MIARYREVAPGPALAHAVHCIWTFESPADEALQPIAPDGRPELIVHRGVPYEEVCAGGVVRQPRVLFAGQLTKPLTLRAGGPAAVIGLRFRPEYARAFLGRAADAATDRRLDLLAEHGAAAARLCADLEACPTFAAARAHVERYAADRLQGVRADPQVGAVCAAILSGKPPPPPAPRSERQLQRRFKHEVGVSMRALQSVVRFRRVFDAASEPGASNWVSVALAAGYFDQPQMARDFRRFMGCTAREWAEQRVGLARALTAPETYKTGAAECG